MLFRREHSGGFLPITTRVKCANERFPVNSDNSPVLLIPPKAMKVSKS